MSYATPPYEEGWWGIKVVGLLGDWTLEDFLVPPVGWSDPADTVLQYFSSQQGNLDNQIRLDWHWGVTDIQFLTLFLLGDISFPGDSTQGASIGTAVPRTTIPPVIGISTVSLLGRPIASP